MSRDWTGGVRSIYITLGASNHTEYEREPNDYYATDPEAVKRLMKVEKFNKHIWEPACGELHISNVLKEYGYDVYSTDLVDRGCQDDCVDFLETDVNNLDIDIITNPPYKKAKEFVVRSMETVSEGHKVAMFLKLTFLEGQGRTEMFKQYPPRYVYVFADRQKCAMNGDFEHTGSSAVAYAWFVWVKGYKGNPELLRLTKE